MKKEYCFSFESDTDSPSTNYVAKRIYLQALTEEEWQHRLDLGAKESKPEKAPKKKAPKKAVEK
tara:strand:+ start:492 stop:683 length:192 start_codon:yes stop_codon:yes gene_type:complete